MGLSTLWDDIESAGDDEEPGTTNVHSFDRLSKPERLMLLAEVARGLHDRDEPSPDPTVLTESTVAAVFAQVRYLIEVETDAECEGRVLSAGVKNPSVSCRAGLGRRPMGDRVANGSARGGYGSLAG
jgi:hypothetical protein